MIQAHPLPFPRNGNRHRNKNKNKNQTPNQAPHPSLSHLHPRHPPRPPCPPHHQAISQGNKHNNNHKNQITAPPSPPTKLAQPSPTDDNRPTSTQTATPAPMSPRTCANTTASWSRGMIGRIIRLMMRGRLVRGFGGGRMGL